MNDPSAKLLRRDIVFRFANWKCAFFEAHAKAHQHMSELGVKWMHGAPFTVDLGECPKIQ